MEKVNQQIPQGNYVLLNSPNSKGERCIYLRYFVDGKYVKRSTDIWIDEDDWDCDRQEVKGRNRYAARINNYLSTLYDRIRTQMLDMRVRVTYESLSALLLGKKRKADPDSATEEQGLVEYAHKVNDLFYRSNKYGYTTWYNKKKYIEAFERFNTHYLKGPKPTFDNIKVSIFDEYVRYRFDVLKNVSKEGINKTLVPLYAALEYAARNGDIDQKTIAPIVNNYLITRETKYKDDTSGEEKVKYLTPDQMIYLHDYCKGIRSRHARDIMDMFFFSFYACGLRCSDIITLEWKHIDFSRKILKKVQVKTKRMHDVDIPLGDGAMEILERWKRYGYNDRFVFNRLPEDFDTGNERQLFMARNAKDKGINRTLATISRNAGLPITVTMHVARHSFAVMSINNGMSVYMLSKLLGHSSTVATEKTYAQFLKEKVKDDVKSILDFKM